jgi:hypothetical protein
VKYHNILIIAFHFPPENTGGSKRPFRIANHLKHHGYRPIVVSKSLNAREHEAKRVDHDNFVEYRVPLKRK